MFTRNEKTVIILTIVFVLFFGVTGGLITESFVDATPHQRFALYFWLSLGWLPLTGLMLYVHRHPALLKRIIEADRALRVRWGLRINERSLRFAESKFFVYLYASVFTAFLILACLFAVAFFIFRSNRDTHFRPGFILKITRLCNQFVRVRFGKTSLVFPPSFASVSRP